LVQQSIAKAVQGKIMTELNLRTNNQQTKGGQAAGRQQQQQQSAHLQAAAAAAASHRKMSKMGVKWGTIAVLVHCNTNY
jgi:hypothetical protein